MEIENGERQMADDRSAPSFRRKVRIRFFWQLIIAFVLIILLTGGGVLLAGRMALHNLERFTRDSPWVLARIWADRLAAHYEQHSGWDRVDTLIAAYPCGTGWGPWGDDWRTDYALTAADGKIVSASDGERLGGTLGHPERGWATPILVDGEQVGLLFVSPFYRSRLELPFLAGRALQSFLLVGLAIAGFALVVGLGLSRMMSRPLVNLTAATRAVSAGDLSVRVPTHYPGEVGELAAAFNRMAEALARADDLRRNLTADVAHELRTPLSVIRAKLEGVLDGVYPATHEHLEPVLEETGLLTHLVEDLRLLALAEAGQLSFEKQPMDVGDLLRDTQVNFSPQAADRGVTLALDLPPGLPAVVADWRRIAQVVGNLVTNALRNTPQGGCITLSAAVPPLDTARTSVQVTVVDTGRGISPEDLPNVFERFWRGERSRSRAGGGSGLGLGIARQLVEMHDGTIGVESTPAEGSRFWFTLPAV